MRRIIAGLIILIMVLGLVPLRALAAEYSDIEGHWAEEQISIWLEKELAGGYPDGTFRPNQPVTRAEFAAFSNRAFAIPAAAAGPSFADVSETAWFYADVAAAAEAGFMSGYPDGTFRPNNPITRQEAAAVLVGLLDLEAGAGKGFADQDAIAAWAEDAVEAVSAAGIMGGYPDGSFRPANSTTRAETVVTLEKGTGYGDILAAAVVFDQPGVYGPQSGSETITGNAIIMAADVTLQNYIITGDLTIAKEVGDGDVTLNNITVKGDTNIRGGGTESIHINGGQYNNIIIEETPSGGVRVVAVGVDGLKVTVAETVAGEKVVLEGEFEKVTVQAKDVNIETQGETKIAEIIITETASNINVTTSDKTVIEKAVLDGEGTTFTGGKDTIKAVEGSQSDSYADQGSVVAPPAPPPSGGGGSSERRVAVSAISVEGAVKVGETLTAKAEGQPNLTATYKWMRADAEDGVYVAIDGATDKTYKLVEADEGKYIKVEAKGTGSYTGTKISNAIGPVEAVEDPQEAAKAAFLEGLKTAVSSDVATVEIDEDNISVTFAHDATVEGIKDAADALVGELLKDGVTGTLTIDGEEFNLEDEEVATAVARAILEGTAEDFLDEGSAEVDYTATVTVDGVEFTLDGTLKFQMEDAQ